mgnify:CR=1 FL=1
MPKCLSSSNNNSAEAERWWPSAMYKLGIYYKTNENYFEMVKYFLFGVKYSNAACMYELGMYYKSINVIYLMIKYLRIIQFRNQSMMFVNRPWVAGAF